jgi:hypothetical protein
VTVIQDTTRAGRLAAVAGAAVLLALAGCGREPTGIGGAVGQVRFAFAWDTSRRASALETATVAAVVVDLARAGGHPALDTVVVFPAGADSVRLVIRVPFTRDTPADGEPLTLRVVLVDAAGLALCTGGPVDVVATPSWWPAHTVVVTLACLAAPLPLDSLPVPWPLDSLPLPLPLDSVPLPLDSTLLPPLDTVPLPLDSTLVPPLDSVPLPLDSTLLPPLDSVPLPLDSTLLPPLDSLLPLPPLHRLPLSPLIRVRAPSPAVRDAPCGHATCFMGDATPSFRPEMLHGFARRFPVPTSAPNRGTQDAGAADGAANRCPGSRCRRACRG